MKTKKFTPTKAPLPENERIIGGDANPALFNKNRAKNIDKVFEKLKSVKYILK